MVKKESLSREDNAIFDKLNTGSARNLDAGAGQASKFSAFYQRVFGVIKLLMGICLLPFVYSVSLSFINELNGVEKIFRGYLWSGAASFIAVYLFIYDPAIIYSKGHRLLEIIFQFLKPLVKVAPYLLPIYTIVIFAGYLLTSFALNKEGTGYFIFLLGFSIALHLVYSAKTMRSKKSDFLKGNYIFGFSFVYILNILLLAFCMNIMFNSFSYVNFFNNFIQAGSGIVRVVFKQLFAC